MLRAEAEAEAEPVTWTPFDRFLAEQEHKCKQLIEEFLRMETGDWTSGVDQPLDDEVGGCPPFFDGLLCWPRTTASRTAVLPCPVDSVLGYDDVQAIATSPAPGIASKSCLEDGEWFRNQDQVSWSNYSLCGPSVTTQYSVRLLDLAAGMERETDYWRPSIHLDRWLPIIRTVSQIGYVSSFVTLIVAMVIFSLLRKLRNPRNRLHMHLFASFIMRAFMALLKDWMFVDGIGLAWDAVQVDGQKTFIKERATWVCKAITSAWQYFIVANYSWILMEGLYLHNLVFLTFCADTTAITLYTILGWGLPGAVVVPWVIIRATIEDTLCWITHGNQSLFLVIRIPIMMSILFNFLLFVNIVRVLFIKFKTSVHLQRKKMQYSRWAKSTLVLVPLFGAHYTLFLGLSYHQDHRVELVWLFCDQLFASFQGCFVALLYCLLNVEVRTEIKRAWATKWSKRYLAASAGRELRKRRRKAFHRPSGDSQTPLKNLCILQTEKQSGELQNVSQSELT